MITYRDAKYLKYECSKLDIKVTIVARNGEVRLNIMRGSFTDFDSARRFIQSYQAEQGARWAAYVPKPSAEVAS